jgi:protein-ribulosamine 3-kinase
LTLPALLQKRLSEKHSAVDNIHLQTVGGGSINESYCVSFNDIQFFCKCNSATKFPHLFQKEKNGLELLARQGVIKTPLVIDCFEADGKQLLLLEWIQEGEQTENFWKTFGKQLAALHQVASDAHGLHEENYMGSVPQQNTLHKNWSSFFAAERLAPMIQKCAAKRLLQAQHLAQFESLLKKLPDIFEEEKPSLLHGDLWSGNFLCNQAAEPVLIDPAVYFGHRSIDLAMTTLFGGFHRMFYEAYHYHFPFPGNYEAQWAVCNLYPLLIHLYLFGTGYLPQIERTLKQFA